MNLVGDSRADGRSYRTFNAIDDYAHEVPTVEIEVSLTAQRVLRVLDRLCEWHGAPESIRNDNGREFCADVLLAWVKHRNIHWDSVQADCSAHDAHMERFNGTYCLDVLNANHFRSLAEARAANQEWLAVYSE